MSKSLSGRLEILQVISCFVLFTYMGSPANAQQINAAKADLVVTQVDLAKQKKEFWQQWSDAITGKERSKALGIVQSNRTLAAAVADDVGNHGAEMFNKGNVKSALGLFQKLRVLYMQLGDEQGVATTEHNIGSAYFSSGDCRRAMPAFGRAAELHVKTGFQRGREKAADGLAACIAAISQPDKSLDGIANLWVHKDGMEFIVIHPDRCQQIGAEVCQFYMLHEYAHIHLGHAAQTLPWEDGEIKADCWAAKHGRRSSTMAAYDWFLKAPRGSSPLSHKTNEHRAERIRACARF